MSGKTDQVKMQQERWEKRLRTYSEFGEWGGFVLATVQGSIEEINGLKQAEGSKLVATREGSYRNWDPDVLGVDEAAEGYIFEALKRFGKIKSGGFKAQILSEEAGTRTVDFGGAPVILVSDPFDGSLLYKNDLGAFYYTTVAVYDAEGNHLATAVGDCVNNRVDFANTEKAFTARYGSAGLEQARPARLSETTELSNSAMESYMMKPKYLFQEKDDQYSFVETFKPLLEQVKFINTNGGPSGFTDIAMGRAQFYLAHKQPMIEIFSGQGVARTAGALITTFDGEPVTLVPDINRRYFVVCSANRKLHDTVLAVIAEIKKKTGYEWKKPAKA